jgi:hypothetical protein
MSKEQTRLADAGVILGAVFGFCVLLALAGEGDGLTAAAISALVPAGLGVLQLGFRDEAQVRWYRCALFVPYVAAIGWLVLSLSIVKISDGRWPEPLAAMTWGGFLVAAATLVFTPPVWLLRALHLWFSNRQTRRLLAAAEESGASAAPGGAAPRPRRRCLSCS